MLDLSTVRIAFLGFGNMASAMADGWIRSGAVKPEQLGAASRRQDVLEARTKARGMKDVHLAAQVQAMPFYERLGFEPFGDEFDEAGIPHRMMRLVF